MAVKAVELPVAQRIAPKVSREELLAVLDEIDAVTRTQCKRGEVHSFTETKVPDGKGGFRTATDYAHMLVAERAARVLNDEASRGRAMQLFMGTDNKETFRVYAELGAENVRALYEYAEALNTEAKTFSEITANATTRLVMRLHFAEWGSKEANKPK